MMSKPLLTVGITVLAGLSVVGCKTSTSPETSTPQPKQGSTFREYSVERDGSGQIVSEDTLTHTVARTGMNFGGKSNVMLVVTPSSKGDVDSSYYRFESNGDVSFYVGDQGLPGISAQWALYPFASQKTTTITGDATESENGVPVQLHVAMTSNGAGSGSFTLNGKTYSTEKITSHLELTGDNNSLIDVTRTIEFAPAIGWVVRESSPANSVSGFETNAEEGVLVGYTLQ